MDVWEIMRDGEGVMMREEAWGIVRVKMRNEERENKKRWTSSE